MGRVNERRRLIDVMRSEGLSYETIGRVFGISKQAAYQQHQSYKNNTGDYFRFEAIQKIPYVGLRNWMVEHRVTITDLCDRCNVSKFSSSLYGKTNFSKSIIDKILEVTGLTYEECFKEASE